MQSERLIYPPPAAYSGLRQPLTVGEEQVLQLFDRQLPPKWEIYVQPHLNGLRPDFVLLNPSVGIAVYEVKDWDLSAMRYYVQRDRNGHPLLWGEKDGKKFSIERSNPFSKVMQYKREIFDLYCPRLQKGNGWAAITAGIIFPFARTADVVGLFEPFTRNDKFPQYRPISGFKEVSTDDIGRIFPEGGRGGSRVMSEDHAKDLRGWLVEPDFSSTQRTSLILDPRQRELARTRTSLGYRRIKGPAGSGKSLVLAARAATLANEDKEILIATFNITLWHYLRDLIVRDLAAPHRMKNITFTHFHHWCKRVCLDAGFEHRYDELWKLEGSELEGERNSILDSELPLLAVEAIEAPGAKRYDAILVDEGQDYLPFWWNTIRKACEENGEMLLVADATQDVYDTAKSWTDEAMAGAGFPGGRWAELKVSYRLPPKALKMARHFANEFLPKDSVDLPEAEQGTLDLYPCNLRWVQCDENFAAQACFKEIERLMKLTGNLGLANADITVLTSDMRSGEKIVARLEESKIRSINTFGPDHKRKKVGFFQGDARIKATTLHSFKGWEARLLIVYIPRVTDKKALALIYTGLTRLKRDQKGSWLTVVCAAAPLSDFGKSFDEYIKT